MAENKKPKKYIKSKLKQNKPGFRTPSSFRAKGFKPVGGKSMSFKQNMFKTQHKG